MTSYVCNPELGTQDDLKQLKAKLNALGLSLMLDFVPNHYAVDSPMTKVLDHFVLDNRNAPPYDPTRYLPNGIAFGWAGWGASWT